MLQVEVIPDADIIKVLDKPTWSNYNKLLDEVIAVLGREVNGVKAKHKFCWSVMAGFYSKIHVHRDLQWAGPCVVKMGYIYTVYCEYYEIPGDQRLLIEQDPEAIQHCNSTDMRK